MVANVIGVVLAGGLARRMGGGDKGLRTLGGRSILDRVIERVQPQVARLVLNANGDPARFAAFGLPVVPDGVEGFPGPLAGVLAGLEWARANAPDVDWVASVPGDAPFVPRDLVARFLATAEREEAELACARSGGQEHPVVGLWPVRLADALRHAIVAESLRKVDRWTARYRLTRVDFDDRPVDPFFNANSPEDLEAAERLLPLVDGPAGG